ncbi:MAG TPA: phosphatase PAP2 family protein [Deltaproteobacteria bacterium]|nr:phosphatase PAP2 family protein [Deltaproteobacteria bacterium]HIJ39658.1 phosphatase PAP2 family protein [Deltaproteobacteria bacterium]
MIEWDRKVSEYFLSHNNPGAKCLFSAFSFLGTGVLWICIYAFCLIFFWNHAHRVILTLILAELMGLMVIIPLRYITKRRRPCEDYKYFFLTPWNLYSFPSHHAFRAFSIAIIVGMRFPGTFPYLICTAAIIGFSRLYLSKHYLSDVLAGILLAMGAAWASLHLV